MFRQGGFTQSRAGTLREQIFFNKRNIPGQCRDRKNGLAVPLNLKLAVDGPPETRFHDRAAAGRFFISYRQFSKYDAFRNSNTKCDLSFGFSAYNRCSASSTTFVCKWGTYLLTEFFS